MVKREERQMEGVRIDRSISVGRGCAEPEETKTSVPSHRSLPKIQLDQWEKLVLIKFQLKTVEKRDALLRLQPEPFVCLCRLGHKIIIYQNETNTIREMAMQLVATFMASYDAFIEEGGGRGGWRLKEPIGFLSS